MPLRLNSHLGWGGDRDGNPFVTSNITREVLLLSRWKAADLYLTDIQELVSELSMVKCNDQVRELAGGDEHEPYRAILKDLRAKLTNTRDVLDAKIKAECPELWHHRSYRPALGPTLRLLPVAS